jgi:broad specificity phosphatase PhoE
MVHNLLFLLSNKSNLEILKQVLFIRHAQSIANAGGRTANIESIELSDLGKQQAQELAANFKIVPDLVIMSPYVRTQLTAQPLIDRFKITNTQIWEEVKELTYLDRVKYANTTQNEREVGVKEFWERNDPEWRDPNDSESFHDLMRRVELTLVKIMSAKEKNDNIVVFTHGQFLLALRLFLKYPDFTPKELMNKFWEDYYEYPIYNTQVFTLDDLIK